MFELDEDSKIKLELVDGKIQITIKVDKGSQKFIYLSFDINEKTADKIVSELVSLRAKMWKKQIAKNGVKNRWL